MLNKTPVNLTNSLRHSLCYISKILQGGQAMVDETIRCRQNWRFLVPDHIGDKNYG